MILKLTSVVMVVKTWAFCPFIGHYCLPWLLLAVCDVI